MNWSTRYVKESFAVRAPGVRVTPGMGMNPVKKISDATNNFYNNGGSIEIHHFKEETPTTVNEDMSRRFSDQLERVQKLQTSSPVVDKAKSWLSMALSRLSKEYRTGQTPNGAAANRTVLLAKDRDGNAIGHLVVTPNEDGTEHHVVGLSSLPNNNGAPYALQHALVKHILGPTGTILKSNVYHHYTNPEVRDNAMEFQQGIGRRIGPDDPTLNGPTSEFNSSWSREDVQHLVDNIKVNKEQIEKFGL